MKLGSVVRRFGRWKQRGHGMTLGSVVRRVGRWNERGRVLAMFELAEHDLIAWRMLAALEPGAYAVVKWDQQVHPSVVRLSELQEVIEG
jgi:hypothetical protein